MYIIHRATLQGYFQQFSNTVWFETKSLAVSSPSKKSLFPAFFFCCIWQERAHLSISVSINIFLMLVAVSENHIKLYRDVEQASCNNLPTGDLGQFVILNVGSSSSFIQARLLCLSSSELIAARKKTNLEEQSLLRSLICSCWVFLKIRSCMFSLKKTEDPGPTRGGEKRKTLKLNLIFGAASGIVLTRRRTSRTTRTGSKRRSTCCCGVRLSRQRSEASEEVESGGGIRIIFPVLNLF